MDVNGRLVAPQRSGSVAMNANGTSGSANNNASVANQKLRKRTKTGCLTCRKRRIKCGEERPVCANCVKSKRICEGYNQRVVWKPPIADWPGPPEDAETLQYHSGMLPHQYRQIPPPIDTAGQLRPRTGFAYNELGEPIHHFSPPNSGHPYLQSTNGLPLHSPQTPLPPSWTPVTPQYGQPIYGQSPMSADTQQSLHGHIPTPTQQIPVGISSQFGPNPNLNHAWNHQQQPGMPPDIPTPASSIQQDVKPYYGEEYSQPEPGPANTTPQIHLDGPVCWWEPPGTSSAQMSGAQDVTWVSSAEAEVATTMSSGMSGPPSGTSPMQTAHPQSAEYIGASFSGATARLLEEAAVEYQDDDYYDVHSDEEMDNTPEETLQQLQRENRDLSLIRSLHQQHMNELSMRRYDTFIYSGMLDHYRAEQHANPLRNPKTARVFAHFIFATGPSLSIFERHPRNPSAMFTDASSDPQQGLWTYTLPMMAIKHQGLLHAMLALSSLHIAKLQGTSITPSYKHYSYAIKRIHRTVGMSNKKLLPTTVAATLLLGFYEVLTADHLKWSSHLAGAKQLLIAVPFKWMTKEARRFKTQQMAQQDQFGGLYDGGYGDTAQAEKFRDLSSTIDESLVSGFMGKQLRYDQYGQVFDNSEDESASGESPSGSFDMGKYELYQDLYWWYARQDVYQAILSGNKLLLDFNRWGDCPPRASMGRPDAVYGTHDHLIILIARIADFNARDRRRKIKVMEANGGQWRPPRGMQMPSPPGGAGAPSPVNPNAAYMNAASAPSYNGDDMNGMPPKSNMFTGTAGTPALDRGFIPQSLGGQHAPPFGATSDVGYGGRTMPQRPSPGQPADHYRTGSAVGYGQGPMPRQPDLGYGGMGQPPTATMPTHTQNMMATPQSVKVEHSFETISPNAPYAPQPSMGGNSGRPMGVPNQGQPRGPPPQMPTFYGMAPLPTTVNMPSSYASNYPHSSPSPQSERSDYDLEAAAQNALNEWSQLRAALNTFESHLGPHYQPLPADLHPPVMTPFGPAVFYRSHDIGIIWAIYHMVCIIAHRCHPHMPPAAMMAAGIAAQQTREYATRIGQVIGGIVPPTMGPDLSPSLGACLCEASLPLFFAGVQFSAPDQRNWLVSLLRNVELRTGWKSVGMVAQGCETAWEKAAEMGRGPPYKRTLDAWHFESAANDSRVARITGIPLQREGDGDGVPDYAEKKWMRDNPGTRVHWAMGLLSVEEDEDARKSRHVSGVMPEASDDGL